MKQIPILDLGPQYFRLKPQIDRAIASVMESGNFIMGKEVELFENEVAKYSGVKYAVGLNSGTDALVIGLRALGIGAGDEVITSSFSFFATAEAISLLGAKPVFVDIDPGTFNLNPELLPEALTKKTKAIIPVHLFGLGCQMGPILEFAQKHSLKVLEDCAQSFGGHETTSGNFLGSLGHAGALSFFPSKNLGAAGDAGMLLTNDSAVAEQSRALRTHGGKKKYFNETVGYNSRLDTIQAAILRVKLPHLDSWNKERFAVAQSYHELLSGIPGLALPGLVSGHAFHQFTVRLSHVNRDAVQTKLAAKGIATMIYYPVPIHRLPVYAGQYAPLPECEKAAAEVLSLPIGPGMPDSNLETVATELRSLLTQ
ncbi:MAG: DegT/DnrJ/EryC1/StrS family aminotransferase [Bacteriovoracia bacterium]